MSYNDWQQLRDHAIEHFGNEAPHPATEQRIIAAYQAHPDALAKEVDRTATAYTRGEIHSPWGILAARAERITTPPTNPAGQTARDTEKRKQRIRQLVHNIGTAIDRQPELFGEINAHFKDAAIDQTFRDELLELWQQRREVGLALEKEEHQRSQAWRQSHACPKCGTPYTTLECPVCTYDTKLAAKVEAARAEPRSNEGANA